LGGVCFDFQEYSTVADHYLYLAILGPAVILAAILTRWPNRLLCGVAIVWILSLSVQSFTQCRVWNNAVSLMRHAIEVNPISWVAHVNLANALVTSSPAEAIQQASIATGLRPDNPRGWSGLAAALSANHQPQLALQASRKAAELRPDDPTLQASLGQYADIVGDYSQAITAYRNSLTHDPANTAVMCNLAALLAEHGQKAEAAKWYRQALKYSPDLPAAQLGWEKLSENRK
jgi:tetratricopeptide (TPR) repeat protein